MMNSVDCSNAAKRKNLVIVHNVIKTSEQGVEPVEY